MKKFKCITLMVAVIATLATVASATSTCEITPCDGDGGNIDVYTSAYGSFDDLVENYGDDMGSAAEFMGQGGGAGNLTGNFTGEGSMEGHLTATGSSLGDMGTYEMDITDGSGVGANSESWSEGLLSGTIDAEGTGRYDLKTSGLAESQTRAGSYYGGNVENAPTYGIAEQNSQGYFIGEGGADFDGTLSEEFEAGVESFGSSYSESYRKEYTNEGNDISALGSNVGTYSEVQVTADNLPDGMVTGWKVVGEAGTVTEMNADHKAKSLGSYCAEGTTGYGSGNAEGYSYTSVVTPSNGLGETRRSQAGMAVELNLTAPTTTD